MKTAPKIIALLLFVIVCICLWQVLMPAVTVDTQGLVGQAQESLPVPTLPIPVSSAAPEADSKDFYQTIIDNNIFHPLGYRPPAPAPQYQLIGTRVAEQGSETTAILLEHRSGRLHTVRVGDVIGKQVLVKAIVVKQVTLVDGDKVITLHRSPPLFLNNR